MKRSVSVRTRCAQFTVVAAIAGASVLAGCSEDDADQITYAEIIAEGMADETARLAAIDAFVQGDVDTSDVVAPQDVAVLVAMNYLYEDKTMRAAIVEGAIESDLTRGGLRTQFSSVEDEAERDEFVEAFMEELQTNGAEISAENFFFLPSLRVYALQVRNAARNLES